MMLIMGSQCNASFIAKVFKYKHLSTPASYILLWTGKKILFNWTVRTLSSEMSVIIQLSSKELKPPCPYPAERVITYTTWGAVAKTCPLQYVSLHLISFYHWIPSIITQLYLGYDHGSPHLTWSAKRSKTFNHWPGSDRWWPMYLYTYGTMYSRKPDELCNANN